MSCNYIYLDELEHALKVTRPSWILTVSGLLGTVNEAKKKAGSNIKVSRPTLTWSLVRYTFTGKSNPDFGQLRAVTLQNFTELRCHPTIQYLISSILLL